MRILLAEDEREMANALVAILKNSHYSVDTVDNGEDAFDYLDTGLYDAAILDVMMPKMDGVTVVKKIRAKGNGVPIIMLTAKSQIDDKVAGLDAGADDYLTKPFAMKELLARLRSISRRQGEVADTTLSFANVRLDCSSYTLSSDEGELTLANKEFQMLEMLMRNPGQIISTEQFMDKIWGYDTDTETNIVWVNISYLRKKLAKVGANAAIKAARGIGYSIVAAGPKTEA